MSTLFWGVVSSDYMSTLFWSGCIFWLHFNPVLKGSEDTIPSEQGWHVIRRYNPFRTGLTCNQKNVNPVLKGLYLRITCQPCSEVVVSSDYMSTLFWSGCIFWLHFNPVLKGLYLLITCQSCSEGVVSSDYMSTRLTSNQKIQPLQNRVDM
jgi:hypothetical protein